MIPSLLLMLASGADPSAMLSLFSNFGMARGCPISETQVLTARHVAVVERQAGMPYQMGMLWSNGFGESGIAWTVDYDLRRDVALMQTDRPMAAFYKRAEKPPQIGDTVLIAGYKFGDKLQMRTITARVINIVAVHLVLDQGAEQGFSGSCVLNQQNEAIGIFHWSVERGNTKRGVASGIYGEWGEVGWMPPSPQ